MLNNYAKKSIRSLTLQNRYGTFIYLRDHNQKINPHLSKLSLSYSHPNAIFPNAPTQKKLLFKLSEDQEKILERQFFEEYKAKILKGRIDEVQQKPIDPLWGEDPKPVHYYSRFSKSQLMTVSHPQVLDIQSQLLTIYDPYFSPAYQIEATHQAISTSDFHQLVDLSLNARSSGVNDGEIWYAIENKFQRGHKLNFLSTQELIKLKYAFDGKQKFGTPIFHEILSSLIKQDIPNMSKEELVNLFYACRYSNPGLTNAQPQCIDALSHHFSTFTFEQKINFLLTFTLCEKPLKHASKVHKRRRFQHKQFANQILFRLNLWDLQLNGQRVNKIIYSLAKLRLVNTKFITIPVKDYIQTNLQEFTSDNNYLFNAIVYLPELQGGEGVLTEDLFAQLKEKALERWTQFTKVQQIRILHSFWNLQMMDEALIQVYKSTEIEVDATILYYFCQIQLHISSAREWQILQYLAYIEVLPLPYYYAYRRFYNYIKYSTDWDLKPIGDKLRNTEYQYNVVRLQDSFHRVKTYRDILNCEKFVGVKFIKNACPIDNIELVMFAHELHQVSFDIVTRKEFVPGTNKLKETYLNKVRSLKNIGWKHLTFTEEDIKKIPLMDLVRNLQNCYRPYVEEQKAVIQYWHHLQSEKIDRQHFQSEFDVLKPIELEEILNGQTLDATSQQEKMRRDHPEQEPKQKKEKKKRKK